MSESYNVVFRGQVIEGFTSQQVQRRLQQSMKLNDAQLRKLFSGNPVPLKKGVNLEQAQDLQLKLAKIGAQSRVVPSDSKAKPKPSQASAEPPTPKAAAPAFSMALVEKEEPEPSLRASSVAQEEPQYKAATQVQEKELHSFQKRVSFSAMKRSLSGVSYSLIGASFLFVFPPFDESLLRRGTAIGLVVFVLGVYRLMTWNRE